MGWFRTVFGLIGEAVSTEAGREVINTVRSAIRKDTSEPPLTMGEVESLVAEHAAQVNSRLDTLVEQLSVQNQRLATIVRRQRIWNILLAAVAIAAIVIALLT